MKRLEVHTPKTIAELRDLIKDLPDDMELSRAGFDRRIPLKLCLSLRGKSDPGKIVTRGGVEFLCIL
ncbi:hypothetical protein [Burkholderia contaminans]|uniref:Uncharacterized protein n=1 Tax=Burkholderia contaminans TaxID=488447 RepID=A0A3N8QQQ8_9BURK|nr:hypothetical protein [Burkholderia contaminans]RQT26078.1 hypothetical protein DF037_20530 [Burkholderia contaminans]